MVISGNSGRAVVPPATTTSYAPRFMLAWTRTHECLAASAASSAERFQSSIFPSGPGSRIGQRNRTPCRVTAVTSSFGVKVASAARPGHRTGSTR